MGDTMKKRIICTALIIAMLSVLFVPTVSAANTASIVASDITVTAGNYAYLYVKANGFSDVQALDFQIYYEGIRLTYTLKTGYGAYYTDGLMGGTVISIGSDGVAFAEHIYM